MTTTTRPLRLLLVGSAGGHLAQLMALASFTSECERMWVSFELPDAISSLAGERVVWAYHPTTRNPVNLLRNMGLAWRVLRRERPDLIISCGAGVAVPFFAVGRLLRVKTMYFEVFDRIDSPTLSGLMCRPMTSLFAAQWEEQLRFYPEALCIGRLW